MDRQSVREGATVRSRDGEKLGKIVACGDETFIIEKGFFFPKEYVAYYADVSEARNGDVYMSRNKDELMAEQGAVRQAAPERPAEHELEEETTTTTERFGEQYTMPLSEEQLTAEKTLREAGQVKISKEVVTEEQTISVPVTKEKVRVEQVPASGEVQAGPEAFKESTVVVPVYEEKVKIEKEPVVKEEIRVSKSTEQLTEERSETVRKEVARIEGEGELKQTEKPISEEEQERP